ncbi:MAG TPA: hypothetical protein VKD72_23845 [Gemmataceae bacterium]|nr:hypothetical protein [Gemmataceae bacterium]
MTDAQCEVLIDEDRPSWGWRRSDRGNLVHGRPLGWRLTVFERPGCCGYP